MSDKKTIADRADEVGKAVTEGYQAIEDGIASAFKKAEKIKDGLKADVSSPKKDGGAAGNGGGGAF